MFGILEMQILTIFTKKSHFFAKITHFCKKKILETNFHYFCNFCQYFLLKWVVFCKKCNFFGENGQNFSFAGPKCLNRLMTPKILLWWKNACPNFFSVGFKVKKCTQKIFDITHSLGCGTPLVILLGAEVQFLRHFW